MKRIVLIFLFFLLPFGFLLLPPFAFPVYDVQLVTDAQYFQVAKKMLQEAKSSILVMMFEMEYYDKFSDSPPNLLIKELIDMAKRGVKIEVILDVREGEDRATKANRKTGKMLSDGGVEVVYDPLFKTTHAKMMIIDGEQALLGSTNWTYYALTSNNEVCVLIRSKEVAKELIDYFNRVKSTGSKSQKKE